MNAAAQKLELIQLILALQDNQILFKIEQLLKAGASPATPSAPRENIAEKQALDSIQLGAAEVKEVLDGKKQLRSLQSLLDEL